MTRITIGVKRRVARGAARDNLGAETKVATANEALRSSAIGSSERNCRRLDSAWRFGSARDLARVIGQEPRSAPDGRRHLPIGPLCLCRELAATDIPGGLRCRCRRRFYVCQGLVGVVPEASRV
jgi:hypothetical protein